MEKWTIYVDEARTQIRFAVLAHDRFLTARAASNTEEIFSSLHQFFVHVACVDRLLVIRPNTRRALILDGRIDLQGINLKTARRMRNHLEHYDERLDKWIEKHEGHAFFDMNITTGSSGFPYHNALRALDGDTLYFMGETYSISELRDLLTKLDSRLAGNN